MAILGIGEYSTECSACKDRVEQPFQKLHTCGEEFTLIHYGCMMTPKTSAKIAEAKKVLDIPAHNDSFCGCYGSRWEPEAKGNEAFNEKVRFILDAFVPTTHKTINEEVGSLETLIVTLIHNPNEDSKQFLPDVYASLREKVLMKVWNRLLPIAKEIYNVEEGLNKNTVDKVFEHINQGAPGISKIISTATGIYSILPQEQWGKIAQIQQIFDKSEFPSKPLFEPGVTIFIGKDVGHAFTYGDPEVFETSEEITVKVRFALVLDNYQGLAVISPK